MYREKASETLIDTETGVTFVALPFLHFKDTHKFDITMDKKVLRLSCHKIFDSEFQSKAHLFGDFGTCLLYTSPSPRDRTRSRMPSSA